MSRRMLPLVRPEVLSPTCPPETLVTLHEACAILVCSRSTIYRLMEAGQLTGSKLGASWRYRRRDVDAAVQACPWGGVGTEGDARESSS